MPELKTKQKTPGKNKPVNGTGKKPTIAEANRQLRNPEAHADYIVKNAVSSAKVEGIKVSKKFIRQLIMKIRSLNQ